MTFTCRTRSQLLAWFTGVIVCLGLVLQPLAVPLHLACNDHSFPGEAAKQVHSSGGHHHGGEVGGHHHGPAPQEQGDPDHREHSAADHIDQLGEPAVLSSLTHIAIAPAAAGPGLPLVAGLALPVPEEKDLGPRPPPPRTAAAPRAPPILA